MLAAITQLTTRVDSLQRDIAEVCHGVEGHNFLECDIVVAGKNVFTRVLSAYVRGNICCTQRASTSVRPAASIVHGVRRTPLSAGRLSTPSSGGVEDVGAGGAGTAVRGLDSGGFKMSKEAGAVLVRNLFIFAHYSTYIIVHIS